MFLTLHNNFKFVPLYFITIVLGTILFVFGQYFLRVAVNKKDTFLQTWIIFTFIMGFTGLISGIILNYVPYIKSKNMLNFENKEMILYATFAGLVFAFGNFFWIYTISTKESLGGIRVIMAGVETFLLFLLGYLLFSEKFTFTKLIGILLILMGIYIVV
uniref:EamA domain-containing protein n=1 Tax=viral metagenome TaxID=1070528 RepID=A0A6C0AXW6_9ZZZZ|tara:strand:+ start:13188 stop:13664 length:477 start_codon:yes stop_codon:yes gene_type:complete